jgi:hypothetical protein
MVKEKGHKRKTGTTGWGQRKVLAGKQNRANGEAFVSNLLGIKGYTKKKTSATQSKDNVSKKRKAALTINVTFWNQKKPSSKKNSDKRTKR